MRLLSIDTSSRFINIALTKDSKLQYEKGSFSKSNSQNVLFELIEEGLKICKIKLKNLDGFVVDIGPGSFTGIKVGVASCKGFCLATSKPGVGISSLDALAYSSGRPGSLICPVIDAKRGNVYTSIYKPRTKDLVRGKFAFQRLKRLMDYSLLDIDQLLDKINQDVVFIGDGIPLYKDKILKKLSSLKIEFADEFLWYPHASCLAKLAQDKIKSNRFDSCYKLKPLYLYPDEASVKR